MFKKFAAVLISLYVPAALAHGGHWHLDDATLEAIFQWADQTYQWFVAHWPWMLGLVLVFVAIAGARRAWRARTG